MVADRNASQKHVWRAEIILFTADRLGSNEIMRRAAKSKTCVWRWQESFMVQGFFAKLTKRRLKRGAFVSVVDLGQAAINRFVFKHNTRPKPFTWAADPDKIIRGPSDAGTEC